MTEPEIDVDEAEWDESVVTQPNPYLDGGDVEDTGEKAEED